MAIGCGAKCAKFLLIIFNAIFWLSGACVLGVGLWLLLDDNASKVFDLAIEASGDNTLKTACYILIGIGAFVFLVGFLGCCGAIRESKCLLGLYIFALVIVFVVELAAGILAALYKDTITKELKEHLEKAITQKPYYNDDDSYTGWGLTVNFVQAKFECCGMIKESAGDYVNYNGTGPFPYTCCKLKEDVNLDQASKAQVENVENWDECKAENENQFFKAPCYDQVLAWIEDNLIILIGVGIGIACLEIFGFIFAVCLCRNTGDEE
ncbi:hypothetical protein CAPTEDRAFT_20913 [Capitella teleta]|uniref:Tetraspanin n=1 Tax=Capitella teleta TaxID=283909 RepID=R7THV6_CAPTE|nr:hypothetical protein CAPTEDRAFT_20913 [Capitella teleta]|eukprot:ELT93393.1 hypothetical protein CAPTEDRAFT_20913 [Capitella teleta]